MTIHVYPVPVSEFDERCAEARKFCINVELCTEGLHLLLKFGSDADRLAAAMAFSEAAKPYRNSLLICSDFEDEEIAENLRYLTEELRIPVRGYRFLWIQTHDKLELAVMRALMPFGPVQDPRSVWERLT